MRRRVMGIFRKKTTRVTARKVAPAEEEPKVNGVAYKEALNALEDSGTNLISVEELDEMTVVQFETLSERAKKALDKAKEREQRWAEANG
jgi:hypothetical protein